MHDKRARMPGERIFSLALVVFSGLAFWQAAEISGFSSLSGAGTFPILASGTMILSGLVIVWRTWRGPEAQADEPGGALDFARRVTPLPVVVVTAMIACYMLALQPLGFLVSTFAFLFAAILYLYRRGPLVSLLISAGTLLVIWLVFRKIFTVVLPSGTVWPSWVPWL